MTENEIGKLIVDAAIAVHRALGPGLLESVYEVILAHELERCGLGVQRQVPIAIEYAGVTFDEGFRAELVVDGKVILELKSVEHATAAHRKQIQTYLREMTSVHFRFHGFGFAFSFVGTLASPWRDQATRGVSAPIGHSAGMSS